MNAVLAIGPQRNHIAKVKVVAAVAAAAMAHP